MGEGACRGTKGWTFNKKIYFFFLKKKKHFTPEKLNEDAKPKEPGALQSIWIEGTAKTVWETLNNYLTQKVLLHFLNTIDFLRNI